MRKQDSVFWPKQRLIVSLFVLFVVLTAAFVFAQETEQAPAVPTGVDSLYIDEIYLLQGELENIRVYSLTRLSLENPSVVDIVKADDKEILIIAKAVGKTALFVWDENGKRSITIQVLEQDLNYLKQRIDKLLASANLKGIKADINESEGKILLTGNIQKNEKETLNSVLQQLNNKSYLNLVKEDDRRDLIQIDMLITELNATLIQSLGINWSTSTAASTGSFNVDYTETPPSDKGGSIQDLLRIGEFARGNYFTATLNAYIQEGLGRVISKPKLVVENKEKAKINVGGQYPIKSSTTNEGVTSETIEFKDYGVILDIQPEIIDNRIEVKMKMEISDIDTSITTDDGVPFTTTTAETKVYLEDQQTIVIAGLIKKSDSNTVTRVPFISKIPIIGEVFKNRSRPNSDKELVITLKPTILTDYQKADTKKIANEETVTAQEDVVNKVPFNESKNIPPAMIDYVKAIQDKIAQSIQYPPEAKEYGWQGTVKIGMLVNNDGTLSYALINESSGFDIFDEDAVDTVKRLAPFEPFPGGVTLEDLNIIIPIAYNTK